MTDDVSIALSRDQALVLFEWLARTGAGEQPAAFEDQAEQRVLWDLEAGLEKHLTEPFRSHYGKLLEAAHGRVRDVEE